MRCGNCRYSRPEFANESQLECHRYAPAPYNAMVFCIGELIRDCAWSLRQAHNIEDPEKHDEVAQDVTEAPDYALWPKVERDDWCAEWAKKNSKKIKKNKQGYAQSDHKCE